MTTEARIFSETIVAVATPPGVGGVAIVRLSGPESQSIGRRIFVIPGEPSAQEWPSHLLRYGRLLDPSTGETVDRGMAVLMRAPRSFTGEDVLELHLHGSPVLCDQAIRIATEQGARLARPGEFTERAFLNGKLDLAQAESVLDLIESRTKAQARLAVQHLEGRFSQKVQSLRDEVFRWLTILEAEIDFGDDIEDLPDARHEELLASLEEQVESLLRDAHLGRVQVQGLRTVLVGAPNAGKSSLLNALLGEERALVTSVPGTTRDRIEVECYLQGVLLSLMDTAGLRSDTDDEVEQLGMLKTREALAKADFQVLVVDGNSTQIPLFEGEMIAPDVILVNKSDLPRRLDLEALGRAYPTARVESCQLLTEAGREQAVNLLMSAARQCLTTTSGECFSLNQRHREALVRTKEALQAMRDTLSRGFSSEFLALDLRRIAVLLGEILGLDVTEEVLDRIFSQFCLGK